MERTLQAEAVLDRPLDEVFAFFSDAANLERVTPRELGFRILTPMPIEMRAGAEIDYSLKLFLFRFRWKTLISVWEPPHRFVDEQLRGPYKQWIHEHRFEGLPDGRTRMFDTVRYRLPLEPLGDLAAPLVRLQLRRIFGFREQAIRRALPGRRDAGVRR